jgi:hypothetical protein
MPRGTFGNGLTGLALSSAAASEEVLTLAPKVAVVSKSAHKLKANIFIKYLPQIFLRINQPASIGTTIVVGKEFSLT